MVTSCFGDDEAGMPGTQVVFYRDNDGTAPAYEGLQALRTGGQRKPLAKCQVRAIAHKKKFAANPEKHTLRI